MFADIEPHAAPSQPPGRHGHVPQEVFAVPPQRRRHRGTLPKHGGIPLAQVQRDQTAHRRTAAAGVFRLGLRLVDRVDERLHLFHQEPAAVARLIVRALVSAPLRAVFVKAIGGVRDSHQDERWNAIGAHLALGHAFFHLPFFFAPDGWLTGTDLFPSTLGGAVAPCFFLNSVSSFTIWSRRACARSKSSTFAASSISS